MDNPEEFNKILRDLEINFTLDKNTIHFKEIILNILKSFVICDKIIEIDDVLQNKLFEKAISQFNDKNFTLAIKKYILQHQQLLKENEI